MPLAFAGLVALWYRRERPLDDPRQNGTGRGVKLVLFRDNGKRGRPSKVNKIVKSDAEWQKELTPEEFAVARKKGLSALLPVATGTITNPVCIAAPVCGNALFRSDEKFGVRTGWPSFGRLPLRENVSTESDNSLFMRRTEARVQQVRRPLGPRLRRRPQAYQACATASTRPPSGLRRKSPEENSRRC